MEDTKVVIFKIENEEKKEIVTLSMGEGVLLGYYRAHENRDGHNIHAKTIPLDREFTIKTNKKLPDDIHNEILNAKNLEVLFISKIKNNKFRYTDVGFIKYQNGYYHYNSVNHNHFRCF